MNILSLIYSVPADAQQSPSKFYTLSASQQWNANTEQRNTFSNSEKSQEVRRSRPHQIQLPSTDGSLPAHFFSSMCSSSCDLLGEDNLAPESLSPGTIHNNRSMLIPPIRPQPAGPLPLLPEDRCSCHNVSQIGMFLRSASMIRCSQSHHNMIKTLYMKLNL